MRIITISREFGSGGRELGKRLADHLGIPCYDQQIIEMIAEESGLDKSYVAHISEKSIQVAYPMTIGQRFSMPRPANEQQVSVISAQKNLLKKLASETDCVIVGRAADVILKEFNPLNIFVYASKEAKIKRCLERASDEEAISEKEIVKKMKQIDKNRKELHDLIASTEWGNKAEYHLCINTTDVIIKDLIPALANYAQMWFKNK